MSNTSSTASTNRRARPSVRATQQKSPSANEAPPAVAAFFRALARRIEQDPEFARTVLAIYAESSLPDPPTAPGGAGDVPAGSQAGSQGRGRRIARAAVTPGVPQAAAASSPPVDPFAVLREHGESALRVRLAGLDLATLRAVVRAHRLDPARISARWTARERLVDLIVEQVRARASLGRAFEHV